MPRILKQITLAGWQKQRDAPPLSDPGRSNLTSVPCLTLRGMNQVGGCSEAMSSINNVTKATTEWLADRMWVSHSRKSPRAWCVILFMKQDRLLRYQRDYVCVCVSSMWENMRLQLHLSQKCLKLFSTGLTSFIHQSINHNRSALQQLLCSRPTQP